MLREVYFEVGVPKVLGKMIILRDAYISKGMLSFLGNLSGGEGLQIFQGYWFSCEPDWHYAIHIQ